MDLRVIAITWFMIIIQVSTKLINGNWTTQSKEMISVPGATIQFSCPVNCTNHFPVWSLHEFVLSDDLRINPAFIQKSRLKQSCVEQTTTLVISNITKGDEGTYCCEHSWIKYCTNLHISELVIETDEKNTLHGVAGENVSLACFLTKAMQRVLLKVVYNNLVVKSAPSTQLIVTLMATKELNQKQFTCAAVFDGINITLETNVILNISYNPRVKIKILTNSNLIVGANASFVCSYDSNPSPVYISWTKDGIVKSTNDTFVITNITRADAGNYKCIVNNVKFSGEDNSQVFVLYSLQASIIATPDKLVTEGQKLALICTHDSILQATITWIRHGVFVSTNQALLILSVSTNDSGLYQCIVNTTIGYGADAISISVTYRGREDENSLNLRKEMVYYTVAAVVVLVLLTFIIWKAYKHRKSRGLEIERTNQIADRQENTNHETNENSQLTNSVTIMIQHEDESTSSNYELINENDMLPLPGSSGLNTVEQEESVDNDNLRRYSGQSEDGDAENQKDTTSSLSDLCKSVSSSETARKEHEIIETISDASSSDNTGLTSNMTNEFRNMYIPLIRNEME